MSTPFKPSGYTSVSPYFIVYGADKLITLLQELFDGKVLRSFAMPDGTIMHAEVQIDDSVIMLGEASEKFPPIQSVIHVYVSNADEVYDRALKLGCEPFQAPKEQDGDPDRRGTFKDFAGNMWSVGTQKRP